MLASTCHGVKARAGGVGARVSPAAGRTGAGLRAYAPPGRLAARRAKHTPTPIRDEMRIRVQKGVRAAGGGQSQW